MKSTLQEIRSMPNYPILITRIFAVPYLLIAAFNFVVAYVLITHNEFLGVSLFVLMKIGILPLVVTSAGEISNAFIFLGITNIINGLFTLYIGASLITRRKGSYWLTIVLSVLFLVVWLLGIQGQGRLFVPTFLLIVFAGGTIVLLLFDNRVKAEFDRGPLSLAAWQKEQSRLSTNK